MKRIEVFDPALCCSTGICGEDVDQSLVDFSANADWARRQGLSVSRFNLAREPQEFAEREIVRSFLEHSGQEGLPLILVDGTLAISGRYPSRFELADWAGINLPPTHNPDAHPHLAATAAETQTACCQPGGDCCDVDKADCS